MVSFLVYDIIFLVAFLIFFSVFLYTRKSGLKREGLLYLYRTQWGVRLINYIGGKYRKAINVLSYFSIFMGYVLMIGMLWLTYRLVKIYFFQPQVVRAIKVPPILPLFPYLPQVFKLEFLPPFFFTYFIVIIAVIAISHEFAHGIFMKAHKIKIKTTGFAFFPWFFPIFPAAFVEQEEKSMVKASKFKQMSVLAAGTFANVLVTLLFFFVLWAFFVLAFSPAGIQFDSYATSQITVAGITSINGIQTNNQTTQELLNNVNENGLTEITYNEEAFLVNKQIIESQKEQDNIIVYYSSPAINSNLSSIILSINGVSVQDVESLQNELGKYSPGEKINVTVKTDEGWEDISLTLAEKPDSQGEAWLGIGFFDSSRGGALGKVVDAFTFKKPHTFYEPKFDGISVFLYNLLWWLVIAGISVALINMLPVGIFDGGRFFYLTILALTKNEKLAKNAFALSTWFFLMLLFLIMAFYFVSWF